LTNLFGAKSLVSRDWFFFLMVFEGISYSVSPAELHEGLLCICSHFFFSGITFGVRGVEQFFTDVMGTGWKDVSLCLR
jgi:hypothetical protein